MTTSTGIGGDDDLTKNYSDHTTFKQILQKIIKQNKIKKIQQTRHVGFVINDLINKFFRKTIPNKCPHCGEPVGKIKIIKGFKFHHVKNNANRESDLREDVSDQEDIIESDYKVRQNTSVLETEEIKKVLKLMFKEERNLIACLFNLDLEKIDFDDFAAILFVEKLLVPPSRFRPIAIRAERKFEGQQTTMYSEIIECLVRLQEAKNMLVSLNEKEEELDNEADHEGDETITKKKKSSLGSSAQATSRDLDDEDSVARKQKIKEQKEREVRNIIKFKDELQIRINNIFNSEKSTIQTQAKGVKQILEKKQGLFRMNIMGKRVNYSARTVVGPDPYISPNEVGIPIFFAKNLTYPVGVTSFNAKELARLVLAGPDNYPGASHIIDDEGNKIPIPRDKDKRQKMADLLTFSINPESKIENVKIVLRHIQNGDSLLLNRQPTLHRGSLMAHKARVLPGSNTVRIHYSNCKAYNADFDGDELNVHALQSEQARAEALMLMSAENMFVSAKDGSPLCGLIQDHIISGVHMFSRDSFFNREDYMQLSWAALDFVNLGKKRIKLLPPTLFKPLELWTGKQIMSTILINLIGENETGITLRSKGKVKHDCWAEVHKNNTQDKAMYGRKWVDPGNGSFYDYTMDETKILIRNSRFLQGLMDKSQTGPSMYGIMHYIFELHGASKANKFITSITRLYSEYLKNYRGFTLGAADVLVSKKNDKARTAERKTLRVYF